MGNLTKIFTFSLELDPAYVQVDDLLEARIASGFEERTIALSKSPYDEKVNPTDLTDQLTGISTAYIHFNKVTLGDETRIGEAYLTHKTNIHRTKLMVVQRPYVEISGVKFATGGITVGYHPDGTRRYRIGGAIEYGIVFFWASNVGINTVRKTDDSWTTAHPIYIPVSETPNSVVQIRTGFTNFEQQICNEIINVKNLNRSQDPCKALSSKSGKWRTMTESECQLLVDNVGGPNGSAVGFHLSPNGTMVKNAELFMVANGRRNLYGEEFRNEVFASFWTYPEKSTFQCTFSVKSLVKNRVDAADLTTRIRCVRSL